MCNYSGKFKFSLMLSYLEGAWPGDSRKRGRILRIVREEKTGPRPVRTTSSVSLGAVARSARQRQHRLSTHTYFGSYPAFFVQHDGRGSAFGAK